MLTASQHVRSQIGVLALTNDKEQHMNGFNNKEQHMNGFGIFLIVIGAVAVAVAAFIFGTWVVVWNVTDIFDKGANFWNVFWILLVTTCFYGGANAATNDRN